MRRATNSDVFIALGLTIDDWEHYNSVRINPVFFLSEDIKMQAVMKELVKEYTLAVFTNNSSVHTERILEIVGISSYFTRIFTRTMLQRVKPDIEILKIILKRLAAKPEECFVIGDRKEVDIDPAQDIGMHTRLVQGPVDIYEIKIPSSENPSSSPAKEKIAGNTKTFWMMIKNI